MLLRDLERLECLHRYKGRGCGRRTGIYQDVDASVRGHGEVLTLSRRSWLPHCVCRLCRRIFNDQDTSIEHGTVQFRIQDLEYLGEESSCSAGR